MPLYLVTEKSDAPTLPVNCREWYHELYEGFSSHYHDAVEMIAVTAGEMKCTADNHNYILKSGDIVLFNPYSIHAGYTTAENTVYLCLTFVLSDVLDYRRSVLKSCIGLLDSGHYLFDAYYPAGEEDSERIMGHIRRLHQHLNTQSPAAETVVLCELYSILSVLFENHYRENPDKALQKRSKQFMQNLSVYLKENYHKPITSADAAQALFMSTSYFSHLVKQHFGLSFSGYLRQYRIECAIKNFTDSGCTVKEIAESVGFTNYCYFSHVFKAYTGTAPSVYFRKRKGK